MYFDMKFLCNIYYGCMQKKYFKKIEVTIAKDKVVFMLKNNV